METLDARPVLAGPRRAEPPDCGCPGTASPNCIPQTGGATLRSRRRPPQWQVAGGAAAMEVRPRAAPAREAEGSALVANLKEVSAGCLAGGVSHVAGGGGSSPRAAVAGPAHLHIAPRLDAIRIFAYASLDRIGILQCAPWVGALSPGGSSTAAARRRLRPSPSRPGPTQWPRRLARPLADSSCYRVVSSILATVRNGTLLELLLLQGSNLIMD